MCCLNSIELWTFSLSLSLSPLTPSLLPSLPLPPPVSLCQSICVCLRWCVCMHVCVHVCICMSRMWRFTSGVFFNHFIFFVCLFVWDRLLTEPKVIQFNQTSWPVSPSILLPLAYSTALTHPASILDAGDLNWDSRVYTMISLDPPTHPVFFLLLPIPFWSFFFNVYFVCVCVFLCVCVCVCVCVHVVMHGQRTTFENLFSSSTLGVSGIEFRSLGLAAGSFICCAVLLALPMMPDFNILYSEEIVSLFQSSYL